jgi:pSer/pThr/pTyr-binding forkhead associated (FHA) protein
MNLVPIGTYEFFPQLVRLVANERHRQSHPYSQQKLGRRKQSVFENKLVKEVPIGNRPVSIGRSPDNDIPVDNLTVSTYHARVYYEGGRLVVEDLDSLNGTFVNDLRIERATLHDGDSIWIGKHSIKVDTSADAAIPWDTGRKAAAPKINETMVLDTKVRRDML